MCVVVLALFRVAPCHAMPCRGSTCHARPYFCVSWHIFACHAVSWIFHAMPCQDFFGKNIFEKIIYARPLPAIYSCQRTGIYFRPNFWKYVAPIYPLAGNMSNIWDQVPEHIFQNMFDILKTYFPRKSWHGMAWNIHDTAWHAEIWHDTPKYGLAWHVKPWHGMTWHGATLTYWLDAAGCNVAERGRPSGCFSNVSL